GGGVDGLGGGAETSSRCHVNVRHAEHVAKQITGIASATEGEMVRQANDAVGDILVNILDDGARTEFGMHIGGENRTLNRADVDGGLVGAFTEVLEETDPRVGQIAEIRGDLIGSAASELNP